MKNIYYKAFFMGKLRIKLLEKFEKQVLVINNNFLIYQYKLRD